MCSMELWCCYKYESGEMEWKDGNHWIVYLYEVYVSKEEVQVLVSLVLYID